jgi:cytochrome P450
MVLQTFLSSEPSALAVALASLVATGAVYYALHGPSRSARYEAFPTGGTETIARQPRRMSLTPSALFRIARLLRHPQELPELMLRAALAFGEQPWLRRVPFLTDVLMVSSPALVEDIVKTQQQVFVKSKLMRDITQETAGRTFFSLEGLEWLHQRKIASRFFTPRVYRDVATHTIQRHLAKLGAVLDNACRADSPVDLTRLLYGFTFQAFAELGFGLKTESLLECEPHPLEKAMDAAFSQTIYRVLVPRWVWKLQRFLNVGSERAYAENTTEIRRIVNGLVRESIEISQQQQKREADAENLVELFIHAMHDGELPFSPELLGDLAVMFMIAGRDTTAGTLVWVFYSMGKHPEVGAKIRAELWEKVPSFMDGSDAELTMEQAQSLTYLEAAIKETIRLYPMVPLTMREAAQDTVLSDGTFVAKDTIIGLSPYVTGRLPRVWGDDVLEFKPERFLDEASGKLRAVSTFQFFGFLAGPRICIGMALAMLEMKLVVAGLLRRFRFDMMPNDGSYSLSALMPLKHPLVARVHVAAGSSRTSDLSATCGRKAGTSRCGL